jgi:hypothetical protein
VQINKTWTELKGIYIGGNVFNVLENAHKKVGKAKVCRAVVDVRKEEAH